jgi:hypothetical protein
MDDLEDLFFGIFSDQVGINEKMDYMYEILNLNRDVVEYTD